MNIELANGSEGYIPPPEQHALGGYTTWPARTAGLETDAEPRIVAAMLDLLEQVSGGRRRPLSDDFYTAQQRAIMEQAPRRQQSRESGRRGIRLNRPSDATLSKSSLDQSCMTCRAARGVRHDRWVRSE